LLRQADLDIVRVQDVGLAGSSVSSASNPHTWCADQSLASLVGPSHPRQIACC
jgi:hypothetical protein